MTNSILQLDSLASELEDFIQSTVASAVAVKKYGGTLFTVTPDINESQFCGVFIYKNHAQISFSNGAQLSDVKGLLKGSGKYRRHVNFVPADDINFAYLEKLLKQAASL